MMNHRRPTPRPARCLRAFWRVDPAERERGSSTVEFVICAVLMVFMLLAIVQIALYVHLRSVAVTAARHGVDQVRVLDGSTDAGITAANEFLDQAGSSLDARSVTAARSAVVSSVTVSGGIVAVIPLLNLHVSVTAQAPTEGLVP
jgi:Flp pilus assembly protein TadG